MAAEGNVRYFTVFCSIMETVILIFKTCHNFVNYCEAVVLILLRTCQVLFSHIVYDTASVCIFIKSQYLPFACHLNNQPDALIIQIYSVTKLCMFQASSLPIIGSFLLYIRYW